MSVATSSDIELPSFQLKSMVATKLMVLFFLFFASNIFFSLNTFLLWMNYIQYKNFAFLLLQAWTHHFYLSLPCLEYFKIVRVPTFCHTITASLALDKSAIFTGLFTKFCRIFYEANNHLLIHNWNSNTNHTYSQWKQWRIPNNLTTASLMKKETRQLGLQ